MTSFLRKTSCHPEVDILLTFRECTVPFSTPFLSMDGKFIINNSGSLSPVLWKMTILNH